MRIAMLASESNPLCKSGGLADVVFALSKELIKKGDEVVVVLPYYTAIKKKNLKVEDKGSIHVQMSWRNQGAEVFETTIDNVRFLLVEHNYYFERNNLYGYDDDGERFAFFALAAMETLKLIGFKADVAHLHDWQSAMVSTLIKEQKDPYFKDTKTVLTIHNPAFKGYLDKYFLNNYFNLSDEIFDNGKVRLDGMVSTLKAGIVYADAVTTVSPTHRNELLTPELGQGLDHILEMRKGTFTGIANGIDTEEWDPMVDPLIVKHFNLRNLKTGKKENKAELLKAFGIKDHGGPVYGMVSRLSWQKGVGIMINSMRDALRKGASLVVVGNGETELEAACYELQKEFPESVGLYIGYSNEMAHKVYAGCDFFLMPSLFEPCGISQMIAKRYGTLPIVRWTGGLVDTVVGYTKDNINIAGGIGFNDYNEAGLSFAIELSRELYDDKESYWTCVKNAMRDDHSWAKSTEIYQAIYHSLA